MTAHIIVFPADRCRQPASAIQAAEQLAFRNASYEFASSGWKGGSIKTMMSLACEGADEPTRAEAAIWLSEHCNISVVE